MKSISLPYLHPRLLNTVSTTQRKLIVPLHPYAVPDHFITISHDDTFSMFSNALVIPHRILGEQRR